MSFFSSHRDTDPHNNSFVYSPIGSLSSQTPSNKSSFHFLSKSQSLGKNQFPTVKLSSTPHNPISYNPYSNNQFASSLHLELNLKPSQNVHLQEKLDSKANITPTPLHLSKISREAHMVNEDEMSEYGSTSGSMSQRLLNESVHNPLLQKKSMYDVTKKDWQKNKSGSAMSLRPRNILRLGEEDEFKAADFSDFSVNGFPNASFSRLGNWAEKRQLSTPTRFANSYNTENILGRDILESNENCKKALASYAVMKNILSYLDFIDLWQFSKVYFKSGESKECKRLFKKKLCHFFIKGLNYQDQFLFWDSCANFRRQKKDHPFAYSQHFAKKCEYEMEIRKDVDRTLPEETKFSTKEGKNSLFRLLMAISNTLKEMGYMQGLNSLAGIFLFYLKEEESFWILLYMLEKMKFKEFFSESFSKINRLNYQFQLFLNHYVPAVAKHMEEKGVDPSYFTTSWFITLFSQNLSTTNTLKLWNLLFLKGSSFLIQFALAIFHQYQRAIISMDIDDLGDFFKKELRGLLHNEKDIFLQALNFPVSEKLLNDTEFYFLNGKPLLRLNTDLMGKHYWTQEIPKFRLDIDEDLHMDPTPKAALGSYMSLFSEHGSGQSKESSRQNSERNLRLDVKTPHLVLETSNTPSNLNSQAPLIYQASSVKKNSQQQCFINQVHQDKRRKSRSNPKYLDILNANLEEMYGKKVINLPAETTMQIKKLHKKHNTVSSLFSAKKQGSLAQ